MKTKCQLEGDKLLLGLCLGSRGGRFRVLLENDKCINCCEIQSPTSILAWIGFAYRSRCTRVVVADELGGRGITALLAAKLVGGKFVLRLRGNLFSERRSGYLRTPGWKSYALYRFRIVLARLLLYAADGVLFNSRYTSTTFGGKLRRRTLKAIVYNPYVPFHPENTRNAIPEGTSGLKLLTVTNFGIWPKVEPLFVAVEKWLNEAIADDLSLNWVICGDNHYRRKLEELILRHRLEKFIKCVGFVGDMKGYYEWCDVLVHLSGLDAFPNVTLEAMAAGKPIIANKGSCGTLEQVYDGVNGIVIEDQEGFVNALRSYSENADLRQRHGANGICVLEEHFTIQLQRKRLVGFLETLCDIRLQPIGCL